MKVSSTVYGIVNINVGTIDTRATNQACEMNSLHANGGLNIATKRVERHRIEATKCMHRLGNCRGSHHQRATVLRVVLPTIWPLILSTNNVGPVELLLTLQPGRLRRNPISDFGAGNSDGRSIHRPCPQCQQTRRTPRSTDLKSACDVWWEVQYVVSMTAAARQQATLVPLSGASRRKDTLTFPER